MRERGDGKALGTNLLAAWAVGLQRHHAGRVCNLQARLVPHGDALDQDGGACHNSAKMLLDSGSVRLNLGLIRGRGVSSDDGTEHPEECFVCHLVTVAD